MGFCRRAPWFADLCRKLGIVFIGPDGDVMRRLGDKISSKLLAEQARHRSRHGAAARWKRSPRPGIMPSAWAIRF